MKKIIAFLTAVIMTVGLASCGGTSKDTKTDEGNKNTAKYHIGIVTGTTSQSEDEYRGAEAFVKEYGDSKTGGIVTHVTYPDNFMNEQETVIAQITGMADDPLMKAIVVCQSVPGTSAAFTKIRQKRPDILLLAGIPQEDTNMIEAAADLAVDADNINRGYLMILAAKKLGAKTFVHISFPRHMSIELLSRRKAIMEEACKDLGLKFVAETAPDPMSDVGIPGAQQFILENLPKWIAKYGKDAAYFCTNDAQTAPLLKVICEQGGIFVESDLPSPILGYPEALGISTKEDAGNWPALLKKVEDTVVSKGGGGRMGTWAYSFSYTTTAGLAEFGKRVVDGTAKKDSFDDLMKSFMKFTPGAEWNGSYYVDMATGTEKKNHVLLYQDTYILGKGYLGMTKETVPEKYKKIK
ncbi:MAG: DUF3798 domain-containing protein [Bacillota bacterium]|nr:DUF3798 domain-containing protein [Bacillota bacterium]